MKRVAEHESVAPVDAKRPRQTNAGANDVIVPSRAVEESVSVDEHIAARKADILALHRAIAQAQASTNTRAWQLLPRHLRRRAASHNLLRLPRRLRGKARAELRASNTAPKTRSEMRRRAPERTLRAYVARRAALQHRAAHANRRWLETHLWHAKRFRMSGEKGASDGGSGRWGFSLAETPHHKSYRMTWRKTQEAVVHDASYTSAFVIRARARRVMDATERLRLFVYLLGAVQGWEDVWTSGATACRTVLTRGAYMKRRNAPYLCAVAPLDIVWLPRTKSGTTRTCIVLVHPAAARDVRLALQRAHDLLHAEQMRRERWYTHIPQRWGACVDIQAQQVCMTPSPAVAAGVWHAEASVRPPRAHDAPRPNAHALHDGWNVFDVIGVHAELVLGRVLTSVPGKEQAMLRTLKNAASPAANMLPSGTAFTFHVADPRLDVKSEAGEAAQVQVPSQVADLVDDAGMPRYTDDSFFRHAQPLPATTAAIDRRRARGDALARDGDGVTVMLIARHLGAQGLHSYTLFVPRGWGAVFFHALARTTALVIGQAQRRELYLNMSMPLYPYDWVGSPAHAAHADAVCRHNEAQWHAKPPAKRVRLDLATFPYPFGGAHLWTEMGTHDTKRPIIVSHPAHLTHSTNDLQCEHDARLQRLPKAMTLRAFVIVLVTACRRGAFAENATVYLPDAQSVPAWRAALDPPTARKQEAKRELQEMEAGGMGASTMIGAVTTGHYALATGHGQAIGAVALTAWIELRQRQAQHDAHANSQAWGRWKRNRVPLEHLVLVRPPMDGPVRAASLAPVLMLT